MYLSGTTVQLVIPLLDESGALVKPDSGTYTLFGGNGETLVANVPLVFLPDAESVTIEIASAWTTVPVGQTKVAREVILFLDTNSGPVTIGKTFYVQSSAQELVRGVNSAVTLATADMLAAEMPNMDDWHVMPRSKKIAALLEAYVRLDRLRFSNLDNPYYETRNPFRESLTVDSLLTLSASEFLALDAKFLDALAKAQVAEANFVANVEPSTNARENGVILDTIGEVKQMYKNTKPVKTVVSKQALSYLTKYVSTGVKVLARG